RHRAEDTESRACPPREGIPRTYLLPTGQLPSIFVAVIFIVVASVLIVLNFKRLLFRSRCRQWSFALEVCQDFGKLFRYNQDIARLRPLAWSHDFTRFHEIHKTSGLGKPNSQLSLQH